MVNKQGQTRLSKYYNSFSVQERITLEGELIRKCLSRTENQCSFLEHRQYKVIYRRYASLYFIIGIDIDDDINELSFLEFIHNLVETLDKYSEVLEEFDFLIDLSLHSIPNNHLIVYFVQCSKVTVSLALNGRCSWLGSHKG